MLARLKRGSRRFVALIWATVLVFGLAPAASAAFSAPVGAFSRFVVHAHEHGDEGRLHCGHHHHHGHLHGEHGSQYHDDGVIDGGQVDDQGQHHLHVHYDACCPSVLISVVAASMLERRVADRVTIAPAEQGQGAPPDRLLRPPIPSSLL